MNTHTLVQLVTHIPVLRLGFRFNKVIINIQMSSCCLAECVGWMALVVLAAKSVYNVGHFIYTTFLGRLLGHGIDLASCGPWAGIS